MNGSCVPGTPTHRVSVPDSWFSSAERFVIPHPKKVFSVISKTAFYFIQGNSNNNVQQL